MKALFLSILIGLLLVTEQLSAQVPGWELDLSKFDSFGAPLETVAPPVFSSDFYEDIVAAIPERKNTVYIHPEYFTSLNSSIDLIHDAQEVKVTFLHEGAGFRNSFGYVAYTEENKPESIEDLRQRGTLIFPNASLLHSGGHLRFGDTVSIGEFPKGTKLMFFIVSNGWKNASNLRLNWVFTTDHSLNPEVPTKKMNNIPIQQHVAMLWHEESKLMVLGFEDIHRNAGDHDFNDVMFTVSSTPTSAIDSSLFTVVPPENSHSNDSYHYYPALDKTGILAFEDLWPKKGDYDFNDVAIEYYIIETRTDGLVTKIQYDISPFAMGAIFSNALNLKLKTPSSNIKSLKKAYNGKLYDLTPVEDGDGTLIEIAENVKGILPPPQGYKMSNTIRNSPVVTGKGITLTIQFHTGIDPAQLGDPPYDTFISRVDGDNGRIEVHLPDHPPSSLANLSLFNTGDDDSDFSTGRFYKTNQNLPWAIHIPGTWKNPLERVSIDNGYPNIIYWATSGGKSNNGWYQSNINENHVFGRNK